MTSRTSQLTRWVYNGVWAALTEWFCVPSEPPELPVQQGETVESFRPAEGWLRYLKLEFWVMLVIMDLAILVAWLVITAASPLAGVLLALPALALAVIPDIVAYLAIHLRFDTTWYVMTDRSLRIRRGIWTIRETTITFENVQNVRVSQGPLQRWFGIGNVVVETAGGGTVQGPRGTVANTSHQGLIEGVADAARIRDLILGHLRRSTTAGLGDECKEATLSRPANWSEQHVAVLREIRDVIERL